MITALALIIAAPLLALAILWAWSHTVIGRQPQTVPEAAVRVLLRLVRFLSAVAEGLQDIIIQIRDEPIESRVEAHRIAYEMAHPRLEAPEPEEEPTTAIARRPYFWLRRSDAR